MSRNILRRIKRKMEIHPRFDQTDMMGVIHNIEYFRWFEEGRFEILLDVLPMSEAIELGVAMPVIENQCFYKSPARFGDVLTLYTTHQMCSVYEGRLRFEHLLVNVGNKKEIASGYAEITLMDMTSMRLVKEWPDNLWRRYLALE